jgi:N-acyl-D-aspartate/D-glutamate deacylase
MNKIYFLALVFSCATQVLAEPLDWILTNGLIVDGSGSPARHGSIGATNGRLTLFEQGERLPIARRYIDVGGDVIAPGFIDPHTHGRKDLLSRNNHAMLHYLTQGVTTLVIGNDGDGTPDIGERFAAMAEHGVGVNVAQFVGHGALRRRVIGNVDRGLSEDEMQQLEALLAHALDEGALGLSMGLFYTTGSYAKTDELIRLCKLVAQRGKICEAHVRSESSRGDGVLASMSEMIEIGRASGARMHIAHIKVLGEDVWGQSKAVIHLIDQARREGIEITADQYPWIASSTQLKNAIVSPKWLSGSREEWQARITDPRFSKEVIKDLETGIKRRGGGARLMLVEATDASMNGETLDIVAERMGMTEAEAALTILSTDSPRVVSFNMSEPDVEAFMVQPWVVTSSDGTDGHPRKFASFPRKFAEYVRNREVLSLEQFVRQSSYATAQILGLKDRGVLVDDAVADVVVIDLEEYRANASFQHWNVFSSGIKWLFIQGRPIIEQGIYSGVNEGRFLLD